MSKKCEATNRTAMSGNKRSKALNATKRKWNLNLQNVTVEVDGKKQKMKLSTKAIKTMKKEERKKVKESDTNSELTNTNKIKNN